MYGWRHCRASRFGDKCSEENGGIGVATNLHGFIEKRRVTTWSQSRRILILEIIL